MATIGEYYEKYQEEQLCKERLFDIYWASPDVRQLSDRMDTLAPYFEDMIFEPNSATGSFTAVKEKGLNGDEWEDTFLDRPGQLEYFMYNWFALSVEDLGGSLGRFSPLEYKLSIAPECMERDDVIAHEMIHLHEAVLDGLPTYYHDAVLYCLYKDLRSKIPDLDDRMEAHGGRHDILFLLKSFELDLRMGYKLGTVFGYGMDEDE